MAMAPPLTLTFDVSQPRSLFTAQACAAKASLASTRSRSSFFQPAFFSAAREAGIGPVPMRAHRFAVGTCKPAASVFQPDFVVGALERVLQLIANPAAGVPLGCLPNGITRSQSARGSLNVPRKRAAAGDLHHFNAKHRARIVAPIQDVGIEPPFIGDVAD